MNSYAQPYYNFNPYGNYYQQRQPMQQVNPIQSTQINAVPTQFQAMEQSPLKQPILQGKSVDSIEVVKATDIPLDGSISYFPLTDGTAIVTKQLQMDGTSKTIIYKPVIEPTEAKEQPKFVTISEFEDLKEIVNSNTEIKELKRQVEDLSDEIKKLRKKGE